MAKVQTTSALKLVLKVETVEGSGTFQTIATINAERGISFSSESTDEVIPDINDPELVVATMREKVSYSVAFSGGGKVHRPDVKFLWAWFKSKSSRLCQVIMDDPTPANVITWEGRFLLNEFDLNGNTKEKLASTLALASDGEIDAEFPA